MTAGGESRLDEGDHLGSDAPPAVAFLDGDQVDHHLLAGRSEPGGQSPRSSRCPLFRQDCATTSRSPRLPLKKLPAHWALISSATLLGDSSILVKPRKDEIPPGQVDDRVSIRGLCEPQHAIPRDGRRRFRLLFEPQVRVDQAKPVLFEKLGRGAVGDRDLRGDEDRFGLQFAKPAE